MMRSSRTLLAARLRQFAELRAVGATPEMALSTAVADNPPLLGKIPARGPAPKSLVSLIPTSLPKTRSLLSSDEDTVVSIRRIHAVADVLDWSTTRMAAGLGGGLAAVTLVVAITMVLVISLFAIPLFEELFESFGTTLPGPTRLAIIVTQWILAPLTIGAAVISIALVALSRRPKFLAKIEPKVEALLTAFPMMNYFARTSDTQKLVAWLLSTGIEGNLADRLDCLAELSGNGNFARKISRLATSLRSGKSLPEALTLGGWLPGLARVLQSTGSDAKTDSLLAAYARSLDESAYASGLQNGLTSKLYFGMAIFIGLLVIAMYLPIFKMGSLV